AFVKRFDTRYDWWYSVCPSCVNLILEDETNEINALIIEKCGEKLFGMSCKDLVLNQKLVDHHQLPNEFLKLAFINFCMSCKDLSICIKQYC
ncbi:hypothetical protein DVH24_036558, partial [Malus domestica]